MHRLKTSRPPRCGGVITASSLTPNRRSFCTCQESIPRPRKISNSDAPRKAVLKWNGKFSNIWPSVGIQDSVGSMSVPAVPEGCSYSFYCVCVMGVWYAQPLIFAGDRGRDFYGLRDSYSKPSVRGNWREDHDDDHLREGVQAGIRRRWIVMRIPSSLFLLLTYSSRRLTIDSNQIDIERHPPKTNLYVWPESLEIYRRLNASWRTSSLGGGPCRDTVSGRAVVGLCLDPTSRLRLRRLHINPVIGVLLSWARAFATGCQSVDCILEYCRSIKEDKAKSSACFFVLLSRKMHCSQPISESTKNCLSTTKTLPRP